MLDQLLPIAGLSPFQVCIFNNRTGTAKES